MVYKALRDVAPPNSGDLLVYTIYRAGHHESIPLLSLLQEYNINSVLELRNRTEGERSVAVNSSEVQYITIATNDEGQNRDTASWISDEGQKVFARVFRELMGAPLPMLIHCATDDDRTGLVVAAIQLLCGVCRSAIIADYVRSDENHVPSVKKAPPIDDIEIFLKAIDAQGVIGFWNSCGLSTYEINSLYLRLCAGSGDTSPTELANHADLNEDCFEAQAENVPYSQPAMSADATSTPCQRRAFLPLALSPRGSRSSSQKVIDGPLVVKKLKMDTEVEASGYRQPYIGPSNADE